MLLLRLVVEQGFVFQDLHDPVKMVTALNQKSSFRWLTLVSHLDKLFRPLTALPYFSLAQVIGDLDVSKLFSSYFWKQLALLYASQKAQPQISRECLIF